MVVSKLAFYFWWILAASDTVDVLPFFYDMHLPSLPII